LRPHRDLRLDNVRASRKAAAGPSSASCTATMPYSRKVSGSAVLLATTPNWHHTHLHDQVLPALRAAGVTEAQLTTMLVDNPRRYFTPPVNS
ncbi:hypothetical protein AB0I50_20455, partial [Streptomyces prunicolor]